MEVDKQEQTSLVNSRRAENAHEVERLCEILKFRKGVVLEALHQQTYTDITHVTALALTQELQKRAEKKGEGVKVLFTNPFTEEELLINPTPDSAGITYRRLPPVEEVRDFAGTVYIVVDAKSKPSFKDHWKSYTDLPNTRFVFLSNPSIAFIPGIKRTHPDWDYSSEWSKLFPNPDKDIVKERLVY